MDCQAFEMMMAEALGDELSPEDRPAFEAHLASCDRCRREYESACATVDRTKTSLWPGCREPTRSRW